MSIKQTKSKQSVSGSQIGGAIHQENNADASDQKIENSSASSATQKNQSEGNFRFGSSVAQGKAGMIILAVVIVLIAVIGLFQVI